MSSMASAADSKLDTDRYGVPQFAGEAELLEEYIDVGTSTTVGKDKTPCK